MMSERYPALRVIAALYKAAACVVGLAGVVGLVVGIVTSSRAGDAAPLAALTGAAFLGGGLIGFLTLYAGAESILVLVDIERNTRAWVSRADALTGLLPRLGAGTQRTWGAVQYCTMCGKPHSLDSTTCEACGEPFCGDAPSSHS